MLGVRHRHSAQRGVAARCGLGASVEARLGFVNYSDDPSGYEALLRATRTPHRIRSTMAVAALYQLTPEEQRPAGQEGVGGIFGLPIEGRRRGGGRDVRRAVREDEITVGGRRCSRRVEHHAGPGSGHRRQWLQRHLHGVPRLPPDGTRVRERRRFRDRGERLSDQVFELGAAQRLFSQASSRTSSRASWQEPGGVRVRRP